MPFTFSHPAIILPLTCLPRKWFSLTGLVIGSLTPDFEYFLRMKIQGHYSHTISGIFCFDLPLGILLAFIFHNVVRNSLFDNLPTILKSRLLAFKHFDWNAYFKGSWHIITLSILIGAASHVFWDSFTHEHRYFVQKIPALANNIAFFGKQIPTFTILQHLSTLIGGLAIAFALYRLPDDKNIVGQFNIKYWSLLTSLSLTIIALRILTGLDYKLYGHLIVTTISAVLISLTLTPILTNQEE